MGATYDLFKNPPRPGSEESGKYHARIIPSGTRKSKEIMEEAAERCGLAPGVLSGALDEITRVLAFYLSYGYVVELEGIGTFSVSLKCRPVDDGERIHAQSVHFDDVHLRTDKVLKSRIRRQIQLARNPGKQGVQLTAAQREQRLREYLTTNRFVSRRQYMALAACTRGQALDDLNRYREAGWLVREGCGSNILYFPA
ncbi:MAG: hypothetical protein LIP00_05660 [Parabacteroides sp.]|nr:hypothetical protein [Parabacteroides sp.]